MTEAPRSYRIWAQGGTDKIGHANYLARLLPFMQSILDPGFTLDFQTITHPSFVRPTVPACRPGRSSVDSKRSRIPSCLRRGLMRTLEEVRERGGRVSPLSEDVSAFPVSLRAVDGTPWL
jgi:hypothetical protein